MKHFLKLSLIFIFFALACQGDDSNSEIETTDDTSNLEFSVSTTTPINITQIKATVGGTIEGADLNEISEVGFVYSLTGNPTTNDFVITSTQNSLNFTAEILDLEVNTQYFLRAYTIISGETRYGNEISFSTLNHKVFSGIPRLTSQDQINSFFSEGWSKISGIVIEEGVPGNITDLKPLSSLIEISNPGLFFEALKISNNANLQSLEGLENVKKIGGISLVNNNIASLEPLSNVETINGSVRISGEPLANLHGLHNLTEIPFTLQISSTNIQNLNDFENLQSIGEDIFIINNPTLIDLCALTTPINNGIAGFYTVFKNGYNPTEDDIMNGDCSL